MEQARYAARREHLREIMRREGLDALIVSHPANRFYLSGFELHDSQCNESSGCLIILQNGKDWLCTDSRYEEAAAEHWDRERVFIYKGPSAEEIRSLLKDRVSGRIGFEAAIVSHDFVTRLEPGLALEAAPGRWRLTPEGFLVSNAIITRLWEALEGEKRRRAEAAARGDFRVLP